MKWQAQTILTTLNKTDRMNYNTIAKTAFFLGISLLSSVGMRAQIYDWALRPTLKSIELYADNAYKAKDTNNKSWLLNDEGYKIYDPSMEYSYTVKYDSISPIIGGYGLLMDYDYSRQGWRLAGVYNASNQTVKNFSEKDKYYVDEYAFFSENLLPVRKDNKKYGYITPDGVQVTKFAFESAIPLNEGKAAVSKSKAKINQFIDKTIKNSPSSGSYSYIDYSGNDVAISPAVGKKIILSTTFMNGEATVVSSTGQCFRIDQRMQPITVIDQDQIELDGAGVNVKITPNSTLGIQTNATLQPSEITKIIRNGKIGYQKNGKTIIVPQFDSAGDYNRGLIPVSVNSKVGLIRLVEDSLEVSLSLSNNPARSDTIENLIAKHNVPIDGTDLIRITNVDNKNVPYSRLDLNKLEFVTPKAKNVRLSIVGEYDLIKLDTLLKTPAFRQLEELNSQGIETDGSGVSVVISPLSVNADSKKQGVLSVKITNTSAETQTIPVNITGVGLTGGGNYKVKLAPGQSKTYYPVLTKIVRKEKRNVTVKAGSKKITRAVQVNPKAVAL